MSPISSPEEHTNPQEDSLGSQIGVDEILFRELETRYTAYRQAISDPFDPVRVLGLTGQVLETVNRVLGSAGKVSAHTARGRKVWP